MKIKEKAVYKIMGYWDNDTTEKCFLYVSAQSEEEAIEKAKAHAKQLKKIGCATLNICEYNIIVEMDYIID